MKIHLAFGREGMDIEIPEHNLLKVLTMPQTAPLPDPAGELERQLRIPAGGRPLAEIAQGAKSACIVICDVTRPVPNKSSFLRFSGLLKRVRSAGGHHDSGRHRPPSLQHPG